MAATKTIAVEPGSDVDRLLEEASDATVVLVKDGQRFLLHQAPDDIWAGYDRRRSEESGKRREVGPA